MSKPPARHYAEVIGDPIYQSKSPLIHNFWLEKLGLDAEYRATRVRAEDLAAYLAARRIDTDWRGCNVTIPHKQAALKLVDAPLSTALKVGAVNCIYRGRSNLLGGSLGGENSDVEGVREALGLGDREPGVVCMIGAGGAARAALHALDLAGIDELRLLVRRPEQGIALLDEMRLRGQVYRLGHADKGLAGATTVINASPMGMAGKQRMDPAILDALVLTDPEALVFDMVYAPLETELLARAKGLERTPVDGLVMLIGQAELAFGLFFNAAAPRQFDAELRRLLTA
jgi:shikimate dehydrogenase